MKNAGYYWFWSVLPIMLIWAVFRYGAWLLFLDDENQVLRQDCFQRLVVAFGWLASFVLIGLAGGFHQRQPQ
jgi:hypothetical protein